MTAGGSGSVIRAQPGEVYRQTVRVSETDEVDDVAVSRFVAMGAYREVTKPAPRAATRWETGQERPHLHR